MKEDVVLALDLGGTKIAGAIFDSSGYLVAQDKATIEENHGDEVADLAVKLVQKLALIAREKYLRPVALGVAIPGIYYPENGTVWAPNIKGWDNYPLLSKFQQILPQEVSIKIESDRSCYILGENWKGVAEGCKHAIFLAVGTGIGAGILIDGVILKGKNDIAGAIGWMALTNDFIPDYAVHGCFEHHASGSGIARVAAKHGTLTGNKNKFFTAQHVFKAYKERDAVAVETLQSAIEFWGKAVANLVSLFNPEMIIFGGGVFGPASQFLDNIREQAGKWAQPISINQVRLEVSKLGGEAGLYGAGKLVINYLH